VFQNGPYLIGFSGNIRGGQLLKPEYWKPPTNSNILGDSIRQQLLKFGSCQKSDEGEDETATLFLIGYKGKLIQITDDFQQAEYEDDFSSIGNGAEYALAILYYTRKQKDIITRLLQAHKVASYFSSCVSEEYRMFTFENEKIQEFRNAK
jgi:hypothetical protein